MNLMDKLVKATISGSDDDIRSAFKELMTAPDFDAQMNAYPDIEAASKDVATTTDNPKEWEEF